MLHHDNFRQSQYLMLYFEISVLKGNIQRGLDNNDPIFTKKIIRIPVNLRKIPFVQTF